MTGFETVNINSIQLTRCVEIVQENILWLNVPWEKIQLLSKQHIWRTLTNKTTHISILITLVGGITQIFYE